MTIELELDGQRFIALNGGSYFKLSEGISLGCLPGSMQRWLGSNPMLNRATAVVSRLRHRTSSQRFEDQPFECDLDPQRGCRRCDRRPCDPGLPAEPNERFSRLRTNDRSIQLAHAYGGARVRDRRHRR